MTEAPESAGPRAPHAPGTPCWVSLMTPAADAAEEFYGAVFGWEFRAGPLGRPVRASLGGREVAVINQLPGHAGLSAAWTPYLASDDVDLTAERVRLSGGTVAVGPLDAADNGRVAIAADPSGAVFGFCTAWAHPAPKDARGPGLPAWTELRTVSAVRVTTFYARVFGYEAEPPSAPDHITLRSGGRPVVALRGMGHGLPRALGAHWLPHFEVADTDATVRQVLDLGGRLLEPAHDGPYGRVATVTDPQGARFGVARRVRTVPRPRG
ncbi:VOC family protein [Streptomyces griseoluteus]|uniref:VOC family protein n=1 Tax=Streptomyces griseoluteus TaxID=29306 RepID=UPI003405ACE9